MAKLTSDNIKKVIVDAVKANPMIVVTPFDFKSIQEAYNNGMKDEIQASFSPKSWKRESKLKIDNGYERIFDCRPFDSQIRAYVITDEKDENIVSLSIVGE